MQKKKSSTNAMPPNIDHLGPAAPSGAGPDGSRVMKHEKLGSGIIKNAMEVLVESLNHWKAEINEMTRPKEIQDPNDKDKTIIVQPVFNKERYEDLLMKCVTAVKLLLIAYGPAPPQADQDFMRFLLLLESYQERHNHADEKPEVKVEEKPKTKNQKTLDQIFS